MAVIHIDGKTVEVDGSDNLLQACLSLGIDIPYFCYHPALGSVGSCRQCAVKQYMSEDDYKAGRGRLVMSCMVAPTNNMYISVDDDEAKAFRKRIVEYLMTNHPHDCPTCEEGGHCHLQDMTYMSGHRQRRYRFTKRTHHNQDLGVFINHEMNRCIACYRCVRFYKDYAGGTDFGVYASNNRVYFGRDEEGQFDSEFSGNLTEVCPTGVFTDKTHSDRYNRKWDMQYAPSICHGCSTGCNISAGERYGELRRIENRYNHDVNGYFLCDKGRFGYGYVNRSDRPTEPLQNVHGKVVAINANDALDKVAALLKDKKVIGIGSPRASLESNFALKRLVGAQNYSTGQPTYLQNLVDKAVTLLRHEDVYNVSVSQIEQADAVFVLGEDITQTASRAALAIRQAAKNKAKQMAAALRTEHWLAEPVKRIGQNAYSPIYLTSVTATKLDDIAKVSMVATPDEIAQLGFLVGDIIDDFADTLERINKDEQAFFAKESMVDGVDDMLSLAHHIAYDLVMADKPLLVSGTSLGQVSDKVLAATGYVAQKLSQKRQQIQTLEREYIEVQNAKIRDEIERQSVLQDESAKTTGEVNTVRTPELLQPNTAYATKTGIYVALPEANSAGLSLLGGLAIEEVLAQEHQAVIVLENNLSDIVSAQTLQAISEKSLVVLDHQSYPWHMQADFVLPTGSFAESDGTLVSAEGRAQRFFTALDRSYYEPTCSIKDAWRWLYALQTTQQAGHTSYHLDDVIDDMVIQVPELARVKDAAPLADYRITGLKVAREPRRYSGRTAMRAKLSIHEPMQPKDTDSALTFSMEGYVGEQTQASIIPFAWSAGWNSPQAWNKLQDKVGGVLKGGDVGVRLFDELPKTTIVFENLSSQLVPTTASDIATGRASLVPVYQLFASSTMASRSPVVASQIKMPTWFVGKDDATRWSLKEGDKLTISQAGVSMTLPVLLVDYLAEGCIGYLAGLMPLVAHLPTAVQKVADDVPMFRPAYLDALKLSKKSPALFRPITNTPAPNLEMSS